MPSEPATYDPPTALQQLRQRRRDAKRFRNSCWKCLFQKCFFMHYSISGTIISSTGLRGPTPPNNQTCDLGCPAVAAPLTKGWPTHMEHLAGKKKARKERTEWGQRLRRIIFDFLPVKEFRARLIASLVWSGKAHTGHVDTLGAMQRAFAYSFGSGTNAEASASIMLDALQGASGGEPVTIDDLRWAAQLPAPEAEGQRSGRQRCAVAAQRPADRPRWGMKSETMRKARWNAEFVSRLDLVPAHTCTHRPRPSARMYTHLCLAGGGSDDGSGRGSTIGR